MGSKNDLIRRDDVIKEARHVWAEWNKAMAGAENRKQEERVYKMQELCKAVEQVANSVHAVDAVPVIHAYWIPTKVMVKSTPLVVVCGRVAKHEETRLACSHCIKLSKERSGFCPHCGAKMDKEMKE